MWATPERRVVSILDANASQTYPLIGGMGTYVQVETLIAAVPPKGGSPFQAEVWRLIRWPPIMHGRFRCSAEAILNNVTEHPWTEIYDGGSPEAELRSFKRLAQAMLAIQEKNRETAAASQPMRTLHAKIIAGISDAQLHIDPELPDRFQADYFTPGSLWKAAVRFSNASGVPRADHLPDMRGVAIKVALPNGREHDLLMTNYPVSHARNARQFVEFAVIAMGDPATFKVRLEEHFGSDESARMLITVALGMRPSKGLDQETFWSRGALLWGERPVRLLLRPMADGTAAGAVPATQDGLREAFAEHLNVRTIVYRLAIQPFVDERLTPIEDAAVEWREDVSEPIEVATLVLPSQDILCERGLREMEAVNAMAFNPWNAPAAFRPLGNINRARAEVYGASAQQWTTEPRC